MSEQLLNQTSVDIFARHDFLVVEDLCTPEDASKALKQTSQIQYFSGPRRLGNSALTVANIKGRAALRGTALGKILGQASQIGKVLGLDLDQETSAVPRRISDGDPIARRDNSRVQAYELPADSFIKYSPGQRGAVAVTTLEGRLFVYASSGEVSQLIEPGEVVFTAGPHYTIEPFAGETAIALVIAGERIGTTVEHLLEAAAA